MNALPRRSYSLPATQIPDDLHVNVWRVGAKRDGCDHASNYRVTHHLSRGAALDELLDSREDGGTSDDGLRWHQYLGTFVGGRELDLTHEAEAVMREEV